MTTHPRRNRLSVLVLALGLLLPAAARAHYGPPFPILKDVRVGPYIASVWADPNIGRSFFYVMLNVPRGRPMPPVTAVRIGVQPTSRRLAERVFDLAPQPVRDGAQYFTQLDFDRGEMWQVRVLVAGAGGGGELRTAVEATPAGVLGPLTSLLYVFPFVAVGSLWLKAALRRRDLARAAAAPEA